MPAVVVAVVSAVITVGKIVYDIVKPVYDIIIAPLLKIKEIIESIQAVVRGVIDTIRGKIDWVLEQTGVDILLDLTHSVAEFVELAEDIAKGNKEALLKVFGGVYEAIAGTAKDILTVLSQSLTPIFDRLAILQDDIKTITEFRLKTLTENYEELGREITAMPEKMMKDINSVIDEESERIKAGFRGELAVVNVKISGVIALSEDLKHFSEMFLKVMET